MRFLVTGGTGFVGRHLVNRLNDIGQVEIVDKLINKDIRGNLDKEFEGVDYVFHLAAAIQPKRVDEFYEVNVDGTKRLLERSVQNKVKRFIYASSAAVYGNGWRPINHYGLSKKVSEDLVNFYDVESNILRFFNVYGQGGRGLINTTIDSLKRDQLPIIKGDGTNTRDYVHVQDIVDALLLACFSKKSGDTFDIGTGTSYTTNETVKRVCKLMGKEFKPIYIPGEDEINHSVAKFRYASKELGFIARINLNKGIESLL